jgi:hypothetical protein
MDNVKGEYYADWDECTFMWCVFHSESGKAHASYATEKEAKEDASRRNVCNNS